MLGSQIKKFRLESGWTMLDLSKESGVSLSAISLIESNKRPDPSISTVSRLSEALGVPITDLISDSFINPGEVRQWRI